MTTPWHIETSAAELFLPKLASNIVGAVVCDPPYGLGTREPTAADLIAFLGGATLDTGGDFMSARWSIPSVALWSEVYRVMKPGAYLAAFAGSRTVDLMMLGIRAAGFEIRDTADWFYGTGKTISPDIGEATGVAQWADWHTALAPSHEPIVLAQKPCEGTIAQNILKWRCGGINIGATRTSTGDNLNGGAYSGGKRSPVLCDTRTAVGAGAFGENGRLEPEAFEQPSGRWPKNVLLVHNPSCKVVGSTLVKGDARAGKLEPGSRPSGFGNVGADSGDGLPGGTLHGDETVPVYECADDCPVKLLAQQGGIKKSGTGAVQRQVTPKGRAVYGDFKGIGTKMISYGDEGTVDRYFPTFDWTDDDYAPFFYTQKSPSSERHAGLGPKGNTGKCVKPLKLMRWLLKLLVPPGELCIDPWAGSGSTICAAQLEGVRSIGVERDPEQAEVARKRVAHWAAVAVDTANKKSEKGSL